MGIHDGEFDNEVPNYPPAKDGGNYDDVPDGTYQVWVERAEIKTSQAGNEYLSLMLRILAGTCKGRCIFKMGFFTSEDSRRYLYYDIQKMGVNFERWSQLRAYLEDMIGVKLEVTQKTKDEFTNVYINKRLDDIGTPAGADTGTKLPPIEDEDILF